MRPDAAPLTVLERYELKYTIPMAMVDPISLFVEAYCEMDSHSASSPDGFYQVNSLYFDTPEYLFLRNRLERIPNRFNMRVRSYGARPVTPYFLEVKQKREDIIRKYRARIRDENLERVLDPAHDVASSLVSPGEARNAGIFRRLVHANNAAPVVMTSYRRKAYFSTCDEYARVTFDVGLRYMAQRDYRPLTLEGGLSPSDPETIFDEETSVILELKCFSKFVPLWMVDLVRSFQLRRRGFSKYSAGMAQVFRRYAFEDGSRVSPLDGMRGK
jgi:SPX domain protein involved in polyphosphate accumulation